MGFIGNVLEDAESFLVTSLNEKKLAGIQQKEGRLRAAETALEYRKTDIVYLMQQGFEYNKNSDKFIRTENIDYGKFPGRYRITVRFPPNYPQTPPDIRFKPLDRHKMISEHINEDNGKLCLSNLEHGDRDLYWKSYMNIKGALRLAYHLVTDEIHAKKDARKKLATKGTVFQDLMKVVSKDVFIEEFAKKHIINCDKTYVWEEIAYATSQKNATVKSKLVKYYNEKKNEKDKRKRKRAKKT